MPKKVFISISLSLLLGLGIIACFALDNNVPKEAPVPIIKYNNSTVPTVKSLYNWFDKKQGGNSHLNGPPEETTKGLTPVIVERESNITIKFDTKYQPKQTELNLWNKGEIVSKLLLKNDRFCTPNVPGIYVCEVIGRWDETHDSAHSFKIEVK